MPAYVMVINMMATRRKTPVPRILPVTPQAEEEFGSISAQAAAVSRMLHGGEESCDGRRSRGTETGVLLPGYDPSGQAAEDDGDERDEPALQDDVAHNDESQDRACRNETVDKGVAEDALQIRQNRSSKYKGDFDLQAHNQRLLLRTEIPECCTCAHRHSTADPRRASKKRTLDMQRAPMREERRNLVPAQCCLERALHVNRD